MFTSARLNLTAWYLLIIMSISLIFSGIIYRLLSFEIDRFARGQRLRIERRLFTGDFFITQPEVDLDLLNETKHRLALSLGVVNLAIFGIAGSLGYFLAGRTLDPIQQMLTDQKRFISDSSHELRTPLAAMKSSLEINLRDKKLKIAEARQLIADNLQEVNRLCSLTDRLLNLSRLDNPDRQSPVVKIDIFKIIAEINKRLSPLLKSKQITLQNNLHRRLFIFGDVEQIRELFTILIENAIKYSDSQKTITLHSQKNKKNLIIRIIDQGVGIDRVDLPHIFDRFYRSDRSRTAGKVGGYGLGLSIAKKIVTAHDGSISADSIPGQGTTFTIHFSH